MSLTERLDDVHVVLVLLCPFLGCVKPFVQLHEEVHDIAVTFHNVCQTFQSTNILCKQVCNM